MKDILEDYTVKELRQIISKTNIKRYSRLKKDELINLMTKKEHIAKFKKIKRKKLKFKSFPPPKPPPKEIPTERVSKSDFNKVFNLFKKEVLTVIEDEDIAGNLAFIKGVSFADSRYYDENKSRFFAPVMGKPSESGAKGRMMKLKKLFLKNYKDSSKEVVIGLKSNYEKLKTKPLSFMTYSKQKLGIDFDTGLLSDERGLED